MTSDSDSHSAVTQTQQMQMQTLDASNHSVHTPIPTTESEPLMPLSPNAIDQFPTGEATSSSSSTTKGTAQLTTKKIKDVNAEDIPSAMKCPLPSPVVTTTIDYNDTDNDTLSTVTANTSTTTKGVRFSPMVRVKDTLSRHDMSPAEHGAYWLQHHDFLRIKQRNLGTIQAVEQHQQSQGDGDVPEEPQHELLSSMDDCLRGLESGLSHENLRKRSYRFAALEEVFLEQEDQYYAGIYDDQAIAQVYLEVTVECRFRAEFRALQDRKDIEDYLKEETTQEVADDADEDEFAL